MTPVIHNPADVFPPYRGYVHALEVPAGSRLLFISGLNGFEQDGNTNHAATPDRHMTHRIASCSCGQLQADVTADPIRISVCHCLACQRRTGSVFGAQARFAAGAVTVKGTSKEFIRIGDEGNRATFSFCPECGATVYYILEGLDGAVAIPVGAFADPKFPAPTFSVYEERMHSWVSMPPGIERTA